MDKVLRNAITIGIIIITLSLAYYLVIFLPKKEAGKLEQQKQEQVFKEQLEKERIEKENEIKSENKIMLKECLENAQGDYIERWKKQCASDGEKIGTDGMCLLSDSSSDYVRKARTEDRDICFKKYPQ